MTSVRIMQGDVLQTLQQLPDESVHCCVTSPPYWGQRVYLKPDNPLKPLEIGSEPTLWAWIDKMVEVFREVRRVLRKDGTFWLNCGGALGRHAIGIELNPRDVETMQQRIGLLGV